MKNIWLMVGGVIILAGMGLFLFNQQEGGSDVRGGEPMVSEENIWSATEVPDLTVAENISVQTEEVVAVPTVGKPPCVIIDNFADGTSELSWFAVNDGVMGGLSSGAVSFFDNSLLHTGAINTNGGGFSSVRTRLPNNSLVGYSELHIRLNTFGRQYAVNFGDARYRNVSHRALLPASPGDVWQEVVVAFDQTVPTRIGFRVDAEPFEAASINELSLILSDGADGPFRMEVEWIKVCS